MYKQYIILALYTGLISMSVYLWFTIVNLHITIKKFIKNRQYQINKS